MKGENFGQQSLPVFVQDEQAITRQSIVRYVAWLRQELELLPGWHPLHHEYQQELASLLRRQAVGPSAVV